MKKNESPYVQGLKDGIPIGLGYFSVSLAFGMRVCMGGFPVWLAGLISAINLTSAGQFAAATQMMEHAPYIEIAVMSLIINLRYLLMSLSLSQKVDGHFNTFNRFTAAHGVTDEIFAVAMGKKGPVSAPYMYGLMTLPIIGWTMGTVTGGLFTQVLPQSVLTAMGLALYAMFLAIIIPPAKKSRPIRITIIAASLMSIALAYIPLFSFLSSGWSTIIIALAVPAVMALLFPIDISDGEEGGACDDAQ